MQTDNKNFLGKYKYKLSFLVHSFKVILDNKLYFGKLVIENTKVPKRRSRRTFLIIKKIQLHF
ncbi:MAG TPA: hypothetical protein DEA49_00375 [Petrotoga sp.]|nr:hypothetical protein [Petrotoga sp.]